MIKSIESIIIFSEDAKKLAEFYEKKVGLKVVLEAEIGDVGEELYGFEVQSGGGFYVADHSEIKGKNKDSERILINFEVDDIEKETEKLEKHEVKKIRGIYHMQDYGLIATFEDIDGNYFQLVQTK